MNFILQWLAFASLIFSMVPTICVKASNNTGCGCVVNLTIATICVRNYRGPDCGIAIDGKSKDLCENGRKDILEYELGANNSDGSNVKEVQILCSAAYPIDFDYDGAMSLTSVALHFQRKSRDGGEALHMLNVTVPLIPQNSGNYNIFSVGRPDMKTTFEITASSDHEAFLNTDNRMKGKTPLELSTWQTFNGTVDWVVCSSNLKKAQRLINLVTNNPAESKYLERCVHGNNEDRCFRRREASLRQCSLYLKTKYSCKAMDLKPPGGLVSCFTPDFNITKEYLVGLDTHLYFAGINETMKFSSVPRSALIEVEKDTEDQYITNINHNFFCRASRYLFARGLDWFIELKNGSLQHIPPAFASEKITSEEDGGLPTFRSSVLNISLPASAKRLFCVAYWYDLNKSVNASISVEVEESRPPQFKDTVVNEVFTPGTLNRLDCGATGVPMPQYSWDTGYRAPENGREVLKGHHKIEGDIARLIFDKETHYNHSEFNVTCVASNTVGNATKVFLVRVKYPLPFEAYFGIAVAACILTSAIVAVAVHYHYRRNGERGLTPAEEKDFREGSIKVKNEEGMNSGPASVPFKEEYEVNEGHLKIDKETVLGSGEFGLVLKGTYRGQDVAVKTLKPESTKEDLKSLLSEVKVLVYTGQHENIVQLVGAVTKYLRNGMVHVVVEFCSQGNLQNYLQENRVNFVDSLKPVNLVNNRGYVSYSNIAAFTDPVICTEDLLNWAVQIANGMEYLSKINVVHGDLASRNILLDDKWVAKISDFGLSEKLYAYAQYVKKPQERLPWKWSALESLCDLKFSAESDVWSFGVTLWEIFTLAETPYPGIATWSPHFVDALRAGLRLGKPEYASNEIYEVMRSCWENDPKERLKFEKIRDTLYTIQKKLTNNNATLGST